MRPLGGDALNSKYVDQNFLMMINFNSGKVYSGVLYVGG